uniref:Thioredoxin domain-containing protein n=1 Tax=Clastoptera arizonana TaxID=38151 RepID=A0A1B6DFB0_9HEMI
MILITRNFNKWISCLALGSFLGISISLVKCLEEGEKCKKYDKKMFTSEIKNNNQFVMFYAPWCTYCKRLSPTWEELANIYNEEEKSKVVIAKVDCTVDTELCSIQDVTGYPTLKFFKMGESGDTGVKFKGTRDLSTLTSFINTNLGIIDKETNGDGSPYAVGGLIELTDTNFEKYTDKGNYFIKFYAPWCGHCQKLAPTWEELAKTFESDETVNIAKIDCTEHKSMCSLYDVKGYPTLLWFQDGKKVEVYHGQRNHDDLKDFISKMIGQKSEDTKNEEAADTSSSVINLISNNFEARIKTGYTFVKFFAPWCGHCKRLAPIWEELSKKFSTKSYITIAKVDCTTEENKQLCNDQEVDGYPTLFLYHNGAKLAEYNGSRGLDDLISFVNKHAASHDEL